MNIDGGSVVTECVVSAMGPAWPQFVTPGVGEAPPVRVHNTTFSHFPVDRQAGEFDLGFVDPPYNIGIDYGHGSAADRKSAAEYMSFTRGYIGLLRRAVRPGGAVWLLLPDEWVGFADYVCRFEAGLSMRNWVKWHETFGVQTTHKFARTSRHLLYYVTPGGGKRHPETFNPDAVKVPSARMTKYEDKRAAPGGKVMGDVWEISRVAGTFHERAAGFQNQLPEALLERVVLATTKPGDRVLEFFAGSGSLGRVCLSQGRGYDGYEQVEKNARNAHSRIEERAKELRAAQRKELAGVGRG